MLLASYCPLNYILKCTGQGRKVYLGKEPGHLLWGWRRPKTQQGFPASSSRLLQGFQSHPPPRAETATDLLVW